MASGGSKDRISISAGGNVTMAGAIAIGANASAEILVISETDRRELAGSFGTLRTLISEEPEIAPPAKAAIDAEIETVNKALAAPDASPEEVQKGATRIIDIINGLALDLKRKSGIFQCLDSIIGMLGLATAILVR